MSKLIYYVFSEEGDIELKGTPKEINADLGFNINNIYKAAVENNSVFTIKGKYIAKVPLDYPYGDENLEHLAKQYISIRNSKLQTFLNI